MQVNPKRMEANMRMSELKLKLYPILEKHNLNEITIVLLDILTFIASKKLPSSILKEKK